MIQFLRTLVFALSVSALFIASGNVVFAKQAASATKSSPLTFGVVSSGECDDNCGTQTNTFFSISNDYLRNVAAAMNVDIEFRPYPNIDELLLAVERREVLGAVGFSQTKQRESRFLFSLPFFHSRVAVWYSDDSLSEEPATDLNWSCVTGSSYCEQLERIGISKIYYAENLDDAITSMRNGKSNAFISSFVVLSTYLDNSNTINGMLDTPEWVKGEDVGLITSKNNQWLIDEVNQIIALEQSGTSVRTIVSNNRYHAIERRLAKYIAVKGDESPITYSTSATSYPFLFRDENGVLDGFLFDFFELLKSRSGLEFDYVEPTNEVKGKLSGFRADIVPVAYTESTSIPNWQLTNSFMSLNYVAVTKSGLTKSKGGSESVGILSGVDEKGLVHLVGWRDNQVSQYSDLI